MTAASHRAGRRIEVLRALGAACILGIAALALPAAPSADVTGEDFAHPGAPHERVPLFSFEGGVRERATPVLVAFVRFDDVTVPASRTEAWLERRILGLRFPSLAHYFRTVSSGRHLLVAAEEEVGDADDGIVTVNAGRFDDYVDGGARREAGRAVELVDEVVDFTRFDLDGDGEIDDRELVFVVVREANPRPPDPTDPDDSGNPDNCGANRSPKGVSRVDDKRIRFRVALTSTRSNLMTIIHEVAHTTVDEVDFYGFGVGSLSISGPTCGAGEDFLIGVSGYEELHWGWTEATPVTEDGWYRVRRARTSGDAFALFDPARGLDDYFLVENRRREADTYEQRIHAEGLVIWRIQDGLLARSDTEDDRPIELMRPDGTRVPGCDEFDGFCYSGRPTDAWGEPDDEDAPFFRTMMRPWHDGTPSRVAVRGVGEKGDAMDVYFDVPGPGVMVDPFFVNQTPFVFTPGETLSVNVRVMNTGDAGAPTDEFEVTLEPPPGWSSGSASLRLPPKVGDSALVSLTAAPDAPAGRHEFPAVARNTRTGWLGEKDLVVVVEGEALEPDRFEGAEPIPIALDEHDHIDTQVLGDFSEIASDEETWTGRVDGLTLHDTTDADSFEIALPDPARPGDGGHDAFAGVPECGFVQRQQAIPGSGVVEQDVHVASTLTLEVDPLPANFDGNELSLAGSTGTATRRTLVCPGASRAAAQALAAELPRANFPEYGVRATYTVAVRRIPQIADWVRDAQEAEGAGSVGPLGCDSGGFFPVCDGPGHFQGLELAHPRLEGRGCEADGCPDHYFFDWPSRSSFHLRVSSAQPDLVVELLDASGDVLTTASPLPRGQLGQQPPDDQPPPVNQPFDRFGESVHHLSVPDLQPGFYGLRVVGPEADYTLDFTTPPLDGDRDGIWNEFDLCPGTPAGDAIDADGCNGPQRVALRCSEDEFRNHGQLVRCVAHEAQEAVDSGLIDETEKGGIVSDTAKTRGGGRAPAPGPARRGGEASGAPR